MRHDKEVASPPPLTGSKMRSKKANDHASDPAATTVIVLRLYIANNAPNSMQAIANLDAICQEHLKDAFKLEIVDVLEYPERALADGILVTPSLAKVAPSPVVRVIGNLSDRPSVLRALGIRR